MSTVLLVTWDGGGNVPPALGLAAALLDRGHHVVVLGHPTQLSEIEAAGAEALSYRTLPAWDPQALEGQTAFALSYLRLFTDRRFGVETREAIERIQPDAVVVDALLPPAIAAAVASGRPTTVLVHTVLSAIEGMFHGPLGGVAAIKGFPFGRGFRAAHAVLIASPEAIATAPPPARARYVGPVFGPRDRAPKAADPSSRRILVSLSTIHYPGMDTVLQGLVDALGELNADAIVTTGPVIDPAGLRVPAGVEVHRRVPHGEVLPHVGLVIGHGGHGTATKALTAGVPVLVRALSPLSDHLYVAAGLEHAGVGRRLSRRATGRELAPLIQAALDDQALHRRARELGAALRATDGALAGAEVVEQTMHEAGAGQRTG